MKSAPSIISADMVVSGSLTAAGDIQVDGKVEGDIQSGSLTIGEKATIHGEIISEEVIVRGRVIGTVRANRVQLSSTCHVEGDILHQALSVETGAFFEGNCRHSDNPMSESIPGGRAKKGDNVSPIDVKKNMSAEAPAAAGARAEEIGNSPAEAKSALQRLTGALDRKN